MAQKAPQLALEAKTAAYKQLAYHDSTMSQSRWHDATCHDHDDTQRDSRDDNQSAFSAKKNTGHGRCESLGGAARAEQRLCPDY